MNTKQQSQTSHTKSPARIMPCDCAHAQQDAMHGAGKRVHNPCNGNPKTEYRCTVCGKQK